MNTTAAWEHSYTVTNGIRMHYVTRGEGPLVLLLHGFPEFWYSWRFQIPFLAARGYRVVAPDLRGYNDTDKPRSGYDVPNLLQDIVGLIQGLGYEKAVIVGHDWGGVLAWSFAARFAAMTDRLIVLNAPHPEAYLRDLRGLKQLSMSWYVLFFQLPRLPEYLLTRNHAELIGRMLYQTAVQKLAFPPHVLMSYRDAMSKPGAMTAALNYYRSLMRQHPRQAVSSMGAYIAAPTLLIWGEQDVALHVGLTYGLEQWVPNLQVKRIPDSGHWVQQEKPDVVNAFMGEFLRP